MDLAFLGWIAFFAAVAAVVIAGMILRTRFRLRLLDALQSAGAGGQPLTPETLALLGFKEADDLRPGLILLAVWAACALFGVSVSLDGPGLDWETIGIFVAIGAFPGLIGAVLVTLALTRKGSR